MPLESKRGGRVKKYSPDFGQSTIELALSDEKPISRITGELSINPKTIYGWVRKYRIEHGTTEQKDGNLAQINKRLLKENAQF